MASELGGISGQLVLQVGDEQIGLGSVYLPLKLAKVKHVDQLHLGIGVDLEGVRRDIAAIFSSHEKDES